MKLPGVGFQHQFQLKIQVWVLINPEPFDYCQQRLCQRCWAICQVDLCAELLSRLYCLYSRQGEGRKVKTLDCRCLLEGEAGAQLGMIVKKGMPSANSKPIYTHTA